MGKLKLALLALAVALLGGGSVWQAIAADAALDYLHWPPANAKYAAIDGKHIWQYVAEQTGIAEHYRLGERFDGQLHPMRGEEHASNHSVFCAGCCHLVVLAIWGHAGRARDAIGRWLA